MGPGHGQGGWQAHGSAPTQHPCPCSLTSVEEELLASREAVSSKEQRVWELQAELRGEELALSPGER